MKLICFLLFSSLYGLAVSYKMGALITCLEQNKEDPYGFGESGTWGHANSTECQTYPELCRVYKEDDPFPGKGDVCDHTDPVTGNVRNACKMAVEYGAVVSDEKTWSWKCVDLTQCMVKDDDGVGTVGCKITQSRITCCCQEDFCTSAPLYAAYAAYGRADHFPVDFDSLCLIDPGDITLEWAHPGYNCDREALLSGSSEEPGSQEATEEPGPDARSVFMRQAQDYEDISAMNGMHTADILLIATYFIVGTLCLGVGVLVGTKWKSKVQKQQAMAFNDI
eukprot:34616_1